MGHSDSTALNMLGLLAAGMETREGFRIELDGDRTLDPLKHGPSGWITRLGGALSGPIPLALRLLGWRSPALRRWAAISGIAGSLVTRIAWLEAGKASARDWRRPLDIPHEAKEIEEFPAPRALPAQQEESIVGRRLADYH
jgi:hypothetical protein